LSASTVFPKKLAPYLPQTRTLTNWCVLTRLTTFIAIATLAVAVLFYSSTDQWMPICVVVSVASIVLVLRSLFTGKVVIAMLFLGVLGLFTPFRNSPFSHVVVSIFHLATLALFAVSPIMLRKSVAPTALNPLQGRS
jgi:hypothetical protein